MLSTNYLYVIKRSVYQSVNRDKFSAGWYDRKEIGSFRLMEDVNFVAAMGLPVGGGRNPITARLIRHFHIIAFPEIDEDAKVSCMVFVQLH